MNVRTIWDAVFEAVKPEMTLERFTNKEDGIEAYFTSNRIRTPEVGETEGRRVYQLLSAIDAASGMKATNLQRGQADFTVLLKDRSTQ